MAEEYCGVKVQSVEDCAQIVRSGDTLWVPPVQSAPVDLLEALVARAPELRNVDIWSAMLMQEFAFMRPGLEESFRYHSFFLSAIERKLRPLGAVDAASIAYAYLDEAFQSVIDADVMFAEVSLPEPDGTVSFGPTGGATNAMALKTVNRVVLQINPNVPFVFGEDNSMNIKDATAICESNRPLLEAPAEKPSAVEQAIADQILPLLPDGAVVQLGIGGLSGAIGYGLRERRDLGIHTEMFTQSMMALMKDGAVTNARKNNQPGVAVIGFCLGDRELYDFLDHNPAISQRPLCWINDPDQIAANDNLYSINSCISVDLTGQVASEGVGTRQISATGGGLDFTRGARKSKGGRSFVCVASARQTKDGTLVSNILPTLPEGTPITIPRTDVDAVVTEYGVADLANKPFAERARALIAISHPDLRHQLTESAVQIGVLPPNEPIRD